MTVRHDLPVVVTRPAAQAVPLAARLDAAGRNAIVFPLLEIQPLPDQAALRTALARLTEFALVAFVSPNAIDAAFALIGTWPAAVPIAVVGEGSKAALARYGRTSENTRIFSPRDRFRSDSETLLDVLDLDALRHRRVLIVRGETGRELLADALRSHGAMVETVAAYRRLAPALDQHRQEQLAGLIDSGAEWIITSSEALRILVEMTRQAAGEEGVAKLQRQRLVIPHVRIAETARALGFEDLLETGSGDEQLIAALQFRA
ncbi:MAG TPA: uroporphyrinogen-III synthase [Noviherbaspirillum sp.]|jgi:uroporphyrinogen-III synthase|uniref:uroporphyrinogen-III synthase n=1 Tax=Noviherbaspirillum sp. TaxID=1926288 RepID=UPI002F91DBE4